MHRDDLASVLAVHFETYRNLEPQDIYKLLYQRVLGPEHLIDNARAAQEQLYLEVLHLPEAIDAQSILVPLSPELCRLNLQPYIQSGGNVDVVWRLFRQTAGEYQPGTLVDLERAWRSFRATPWAVHYRPAKLDQFWQYLATANFPSVHHSRGYAEVNQPHYRVVLRHLVTEQLGF